LLTGILEAFFGVVSRPGISRKMPSRTTIVKPVKIPAMIKRNEKAISDQFNETRMCEGGSSY